MLVVTYLRPQLMTGALGFAPVARLEPGSAQLVPARFGNKYDAGLRPADLFIHSVEPGSPAAEIGVHPGDVLAALDGQPLTSWEMFAQALEERPDVEHVVRWHSSDGDQQARFQLRPRRELDEYQTEATTWVFGAEGARATQPVPEVPVERHLIGAVVSAVGRALSVTGTLARALGPKFPSSGI
jgi:hypothetical protein